jgi:hypothetical protein
VKIVSVEEFELLSFFEVEPSRADADQSWPYNDYTFAVSFDAFKVSFGIAPAYRDVSLAISHNDADIYFLTALSADDVRYHRTGDRKTLEIRLSVTDTIWFQLRPAPLITHSADVA